VACTLVHTRRITRICGTPGGAVAVHSQSSHSLTWLTALVFVCVAGVSPAAFASPGTSSNRVGRCRSFTVGTAVYTDIRVVGVMCPLVTRLLNQSMLSKIRRGRMSWTYGGFRWWFLPTDPLGGMVIGTSGTKLITAGFGVS
jgi:hypothetical protein